MAPAPLVASVSLLKENAFVRDSLFRNPNQFVAGQVHSQVANWEHILDCEIPKHAEIMSYVKNKVNLHDFIGPFKGDIQGRVYNCPSPPRMLIPNNASCLGFENFITSTDCQHSRIMCSIVELLQKKNPQLVC